jgi:hypothetical protein
LLGKTRTAREVQKEDRIRRGKIKDGQPPRLSKNKSTPKNRSK